MDENAKFVPKNINTYLRHFWSCLVHKINEGGWEANTEHQSIRRIESKMKDFETNFL